MGEGGRDKERRKRAREIDGGMGGGEAREERGGREAEEREK